MADLTDEERQIMTVWVCLEHGGNAPDGNDVWYFQGVFTEEDRAREACQNEYFAIGPCLLNDVAKGAWKGLYYPRRTVGSGTLTS